MNSREKSSVSVCIAMCNGEAYIRDQLKSILVQLGPMDEIIIVDDASTDSSRIVVSEIDDPRIRVLVNEQRHGHVATFARSIAAARGDYILLSDQDDVWLPGRVEYFTEAFTQGAAVVASNLRLFYPNGAVEEASHTLAESDSGRQVRNVISMLRGTIPYFGCAMGFDARIRNIYLPIPSYMEGHDLWLGLVGNCLGHMRHLEAPTVMRRIHGGNLTPIRRRSLGKVIATRFRLMRALVEICFRVARSSTQ